MGAGNRRPERLTASGAGGMSSGSACGRSSSGPRTGLQTARPANGALAIAIVIPVWSPIAKTPTNNVASALQPTVVETWMKRVTRRFAERDQATTKQVP